MTDLSFASSFAICEESAQPISEVKKCTISTNANPKRSITSVRDLQSKLFEQMLMAQVNMQLELRLAEIDRMKACLSKNWNWFKTAGVSTERAAANCQTLLSRSKNKIRENWSEMRTELALVKPRFRSDQLNADQSTWYSSSPSHQFSDFASLPPLSEPERMVADSKYIEDYQRASLRFGGKDPTQFKNLRGEQAAVVKHQIEEARKRHHKNYLALISQNPVMGFITSEAPSDPDLVIAFEKMEEKISGLKRTLKEQSAEDPVNFTNYFQFKGTINSILKQNPVLCSAAEDMKSELDKRKTKETLLDVGIAMVASVPCFFGGPLGWGLCAAGGLGVGAHGVYQASEETESNLAQALSTQSTEDFSRLGESERKLWAQKVLLPLALWGSGAGAAHVTGSIGTHAAAASSQTAADIALSSAGRTSTEVTTGISSATQSTSTTAAEAGKVTRSASDRRVSPNRKVVDRIKENENVQVEKLEIRDWAEGTSARSREDGDHSILYIDKTELSRNRLSSKLIHESVHLSTQQAARKGTPAELDIWVTSSKAEIGPKGYEMGFGLDEARAHQVEAYVYRYNGAREESLKAKVGLRGAEDLARSTAQRFTTTSQRFTTEALQQIESGAYNVSTRGDRAIVEWFSATASDKLTFHIRLPLGRSFTKPELNTYVVEAVKRAHNRLRSIDESLNNRRP